MSEKVNTYFDSKYDKKGPLRKVFTFPIKSLKHLTNKEFGEFKRDARIEFNIAKNGTLVDTPVKTGKMLGSYNFNLVFTRDNVSVSVKNSTKYLHYNNSGTPLINAKDFVTDNFSEFEHDLNDLVKEYRELNNVED